MKFRCERDVLAEALATAGRAVANRGGALPVLSGVHLKLEGDSLEVTGSEDEIGDGRAQVFDCFGEICSLEGYVAVITHESRDTPPFGHRTTEQQNRLPAQLTHRLVGARGRVAPECRRPRHGQVYRRPTTATLAIEPGRSGAGGGALTTTSDAGGRDRHTWTQDRGIDLRR